MDRRKALKNIGLGAGAIAVTPTVASLFQSCQKSASWVPVAFSQEHWNVISELTELIIPKTDIPGAKELKLAAFIDAYVDAVLDAPTQQAMQTGIKSFVSVALADTEKTSAVALSIEDLDGQLAKYLKAETAQQENWNQQAWGYLEAVEKGEEIAEIPMEALAAGFASELRNFTVSAYKTSEYIGENVLAYDPVPGRQEGCVDLMETTGGKAWSL